MVKPCPQAVPRCDAIVLSQQQGSKESIPVVEHSSGYDYIDSLTGS